MGKNTEYEGRILEVDIEAISQKIIELGGSRKGDYLFRRYVFDTIPAAKGAWIRLRTDGTTSTLTFKYIHDDSVSGTEEWEVEVADFETTLEILKGSGLQPKGYQENRRREFSFKDALLAIDTWPLIPPYLEVEADNEASVRAIVKELGLAAPELIGENTEKIYARYGIDITIMPELKL